ncbi:hypothetical protein FSP39_024596 [Pinctada imbricata]|uniref:Uncharacterized protein n=1 Tax=Pinctada imbricata TaxID=66713 RepID=A0AA88YBS4_PINIB|nr:hypothetical protein FSP39_024596 [Pinctada imbricata]
MQEESQNKVRRQLKDEIDGLNLEVDNLREKLLENNAVIRDLRARVVRSEGNSLEALRRSNRNEQYSRKTNVKVCGVRESDDENTLEVVKQVLDEKAGVKISDSDVIAVHRIPSKKRTEPKPILLKVKNSEIKSRIMRKRSDVKKKGGNVRLVDDVTERNIILINRLNSHPQIESAYYYNGSVYGISAGKRYRFDIEEDVDSKLKSGKGRPVQLRK